MADEFTVGNASISITPSFAGFLDAIDEQTAKAGESAGNIFSDAFRAAIGELSVRVGLDDAVAKAGIEDLSLDADKLGAKSPTITPTVDDSKAVPELAAIKAAADAA